MRDSNGAPTRILCINTATDICEVIAKLFRNRGVSATSSLGEAARLIEEQRFGLVITGGTLLDATGLEVCQYVQRRCPGLPVVVLSTRRKLSPRVVAEAGGSRFVPYECDSWPDQLQAAVAEASESAAGVTHASRLPQANEKRAAF